MSDLKLKNIVFLRKRLIDVKNNYSGFEGDLINATQSDFEVLLNVWDTALQDSFQIETNRSINKDSINSFIGKDVHISISTGNYNYFETFEDFISGNRFKTLSDFYIFEINYFSSNPDIPDEIKAYKSNLELIKLLRLVRDYEKKVGNDLEFLFYKSENAVVLNLNYKASDLRIISDAQIKELSEHFNTKTDRQERKQIFKNELISILNNKGTSYRSLLESWEIIVDNYKKSFHLYLSEFSFEKIKTSSIQYFHDLNDKIAQTIGKISGYIYAVPIAYIFLIRYFDFDSRNFLADLLMLIVGILFFTLVWFVAFKNVSDSFNFIENDIIRFQEKIANNRGLQDIESELKKLKDETLKKQRRKLNIAKFVSLTILLLTIFTFLFIYHQKILCFFSSNV